MPDTELDRAAIVAEMERIERASIAHATVVSGSPEQVERATDAVRAIFAARGVTALEAMEGWGAEEEWDLNGFAPDCEPTEKQGKSAGAWLDAIAAATAAALGSDVTCIYPGGPIEILLVYDADDYEALKDRLFPESARELEEEDARVHAAFRADGIDPDTLPTLRF